MLKSPHLKEIFFSPLSASQTSTLFFFLHHQEHPAHIVYFIPISLTLTPTMLYRLFSEGLLFFANFQIHWPVLAISLFAFTAVINY